MTNQNQAERAAAFTEAATEVHAGAYDYSHVAFEYVNAHSKVTIGCPKHGTFMQTPNEHKRGAACPSCSKRRGASVASRAELFVSRAREIHGDIYTYDTTAFVDQRTPVDILCSVHGPFQQRPVNHLAGHRCPGCADTNRAATRQRWPALPGWPAWWN